MTTKPSLPRITEPDEDLVHYVAAPTSDLVTLCGLTDFIGHRKRGERTTAKVTCFACRNIVDHIHAHAAPKPEGNAK